MEEKAKVEAKQLIAEVGKLQTQAAQRQTASKASVDKLIAEINKLQVAAVKERDQNKARQVKQETKKLFETQLRNIAVEQQSLRDQMNRLMQANQKYDLARKQGAGQLGGEDGKRQQQIQQLFKKKKTEFAKLNQEAEAVRAKASQKGIALSDTKEGNAAGTEGSAADLAKAEAQRLIREVGQPSPVSGGEEIPQKSSEVSKLISEITQLQHAADQGLLSEEEAKQLEERVKRIENRQKNTRDQINQLTQAKIKYELALMRSNEQKESIRQRREQDEQLQDELSQLISDKEDEQRQLMEELELIRLHSEQEAAMLKAQRDAALAMAEQSPESLGDYHPARKSRVLSYILVLLAALIGGAGVFLMTPYSRELLGLNETPTPQVPPSVAKKPVETAKPTEKKAPEPVKTGPPRAMGLFQDSLNSGGRGPRMVRLAGNSFWMGRDKTPGEGPRALVTLGNYAISQYEITYLDYQRFARDTGRPLPFDNHFGKSRRPVINVSWHDAVAYTEWLSAETGFQYRLPSEREWEFAAGTGIQTAFWWGDEMKPNGANCRGCESEYAGRMTAEVGGFSPNPVGLHDTIGNVMEWTQSCFHPSYQGAPRGGRIWEGGNCGFRVVRGGAYDTPPEASRVTARKKFRPDTAAANIGFRVVRID